MAKIKVTILGAAESIELELVDIATLSSDPAAHPGTRIELVGGSGMTVHETMEEIEATIQASEEPWAAAYMVKNKAAGAQ